MNPEIIQVDCKGCDGRGWRCKFKQPMCSGSGEHREDCDMCDRGKVTYRLTVPEQQ